VFRRCSVRKKLFSPSRYQPAAMGYMFRVWFGESFETLHPATGPENKNKLLAGGDCIRTAKKRGRKGV